MYISCYFTDIAAMPPKQDKKDAKEADLTAVVVVDSFDRRFSPLNDGKAPWVSLL